MSSKMKSLGGGCYRLPNGRMVRGKAKAEAAQKGVELAAFASDLTRRIDFARRAGIQYGGDRDVYTVAGYIKPGTERFEDYFALYDRNEIAGRVIDMAPATTWKNPPDIVEPDMDQEKGTEFTNEFDALAKRLHLWERLTRADTLSRIGRYGVLLIGVAGEDVKLAEPMEKLRGPDDVIFLSAFHEKDAEIDTWIKNTADPRFGQPDLYEIDLSSGVQGFSAIKQKVHHSRIIHIAEGRLADEVYGRPILKRLLNRFMDLDKITASTGEAFWQLATRILTGNLDDKSIISPEDFVKLGESMEEMVHDLRRQFLGKGVELQWLESTPPDPAAAADLNMMLIAAGASIPKRVLFGTETGERASEQDERQWLGSISERQEQFAEPMILRAFIDRLIDFGGLSRPKKGYEALWPTLFEESEAVKAESNLNRAETAKALTPLGGDPIALVEIDDEGTIKLRSTAEPTPDGEVKPEPKPGAGDLDESTLDEV